MLLAKFIEIILNIDKYLNELIQNFGAQTYILFFIILFCETGLVITPFLPGDSLLFAIGALSSQGTLNIYILFITLSAAAIIGDSVNYKFGQYLGKKAFKENSKLFKKKYLIKTEKFYEKHGNKTIVLARFIPIIRTFAPFVAGISKMDYKKFLAYNMFGGILWVGLLLFAGYFFGNIKFVKENFSLVILGIILISLIPAVIEYLNEKHKQKYLNDK
ncbi:MAG TPA: DedA family protein [Candidatus Nanoarchaeia archaeon]|nr:DedA family protein [Candidatus Nanoarchaeia archaeon]